MKLKHKQYDLGATFGVPGANGMIVNGYEKVAGVNDLPRIPGYQWQKDLLRICYMWWMFGKNDGIYVMGPTQCGKSSMMYEFCVALGIPFYEVTLFRSFEFDRLQGHYGLIDGNTQFQYGPLPLSMGVYGYPGVLMLNEMPIAEDGVLVGLHEVALGRSITLEANGGEVITPIPGFRIAGTGNCSLTLGDITGQFHGSRAQNVATGERFWKVKATYMDADLEKTVVMNAVPGMPERIVESMVEIANTIRSLHMSESERADAMEMTMSTSSLVRWANIAFLMRNATRDGKNPFSMAIEIAMTNDASPSTAEAVREIVETKFPIEVAMDVAKKAAGNV